MKTKRNIFTILVIILNCIAQSKSIKTKHMNKDRLV